VRDPKKTINKNQGRILMKPKLLGNFFFRNLHHSPLRKLDSRKQAKQSKIVGCGLWLFSGGGGDDLT